MVVSGAAALAQSPAAAVLSAALERIPADGARAIAQAFVDVAERADTTVLPPMLILRLARLSLIHI